jgi:predicted transcriptional regulator
MPKMELGTIMETVPHIFKRPVLSVEARDSIIKTATFLAIGPQIYADGLVVIDGNTPAGRIGGRHVIKHILESRGEEWQHVPVSDVMDSSVCGVDAGSSLSYALDVFDETRFAFVPITVNYKIATSLSIRDVQRFVISRAAEAYPSKLDGPAIDLASPIVALEDDASVGKTLAAMVQNNIRNIVIIKQEKDDKTMGIINDRKVLEFLLSHDGRRIISEEGIRGLYDIKVTELDLLVPRTVTQVLTGRRAAELMSDACTPCLLVERDKSPRRDSEHYIVTPWDIVMRGFYHGADDTKNLRSG